MIICILGRQPAFGLAELESRFGSDRVSAIGHSAASVDVSADDIPAHLLGSVIKLATPITTIPTINWDEIMSYLSTSLPDYLARLPEGKVKLGLSAYELQVSLKTLQRSGLQLKKSLRATGRPVRVVPNTEITLNSAQILHNQLTRELGCELLLIRDGRQTHIAQTIYVQDIDDYAKRDFGRPKRDAFVGMLPPKLAQTMLNLAQTKLSARVLDPFCGTGVVLQEAALMGGAPYGTDINQRMIDFSRTNLAWLKSTYQIEFDETLEAADATTAAWQPPLDAVVCETYLGKPLTHLPQPDQLKKIIDECNDITKRFLQNLHKQLTPGTRCCIAVPAWFVHDDFLHLQVIDDLEKMGYNRVSFQHAANNELIYHRSDQLTARELLVLTVKE